MQLITNKRGQVEVSKPVRVISITTVREMAERRQVDGSQSTDSAKKTSRHYLMPGRVVDIANAFPRSRTLTYKGVADNTGETPVRVVSAMLHTLDARLLAQERKINHLMSILYGRAA